MKISFMGKMGDLTYALPVTRALVREGNAIDLILSPLCYPIVPLLWETPYIDSIVVDTSKAYQCNGKIVDGWDYFKNGEGINLSQQPKFYEEGCPYPWTLAYAKLAGIKDLQEQDFLIFPSLVNHRRWLCSAEVCYDGKAVWSEPTIIVAPETESVPESSHETWQSVIHFMKNFFRPIVIGRKGSEIPFLDCVDLRGLTSVPLISRLIAESSGVIGGHSLPVHLGRHSEVPTIMLQNFITGLERSTPIYKPPRQFEESKWQDACDYMLEIAKSPNLVFKGG